MSNQILNLRDISETFVNRLIADQITDLIKTFEGTHVADYAEHGDKFNLDMQGIIEVVSNYMPRFLEKLQRLADADEGDSQLGWLLDLVGYWSDNNSDNAENFLELLQEHANDVFDTEYDLNELFDNLIETLNVTEDIISEVSHVDPESISLIHEDYFSDYIIDELVAAGECTTGFASSVDTTSLVDSCRIDYDSLNLDGNLFHALKGEWYYRK